jgi:hypothetical protein
MSTIPQHVHSNGEGCDAAGRRFRNCRITSLRSRTAVANVSLVKRYFELLGQICDHVMWVFDCEQVSTEFFFVEFSREF